MCVFFSLLLCCFVFGVQVFSDQFVCQPEFRERISIGSIKCVEVFSVVRAAYIPAGFSTFGKRTSGGTLGPVRGYSTLNGSLDFTFSTFNKIV